ncbi:MAG: DUF2971 domain-containing protein [Planctomycetota bacterium]
MSSKDIADPNPSSLYHYCNLNGFMGIIGSHSFHLHQLSMMNDTMEYNWLKKVMKEESVFSGVGRARFDRVLFRYLMEKQHDDPYCICFSEEPDDLPQWRAYGDDGRGFAIGFRRDAFLKKNTNKGIFLDKVEYRRERQNIIAADILKRFYEYMEANCEPFKEEVGESSFQLYASHEDHLTQKLTNFFQGEDVQKQLILCKNDAFQSEREWRFVATSFHEIYSNDEHGKAATPIYNRTFTPRGAAINHHLVLDFDRCLENIYIDEIWLGPNNPAIENSRALRLFLNKSRFVNVSIRTSRATYRSSR